jgi:hypothetical protein
LAQELPGGWPVGVDSDRLRTEVYVLLTNLTAIDQVRVATPDTIVRVIDADLGGAATLPGSPLATVVIAYPRAAQN